MLRKTLTFRQIFITTAILLFANLAFNVFTASSNKTPVQSVNPRSYQIELLDEDAIIYDGERVVGIMQYKGHENCQFNMLMIKDND